jgi:hypothetical protein
LNWLRRPYYPAGKHRYIAADGAINERAIGSDAGFVKNDE